MADWRTTCSDLGQGAHMGRGRRGERVKFITALQGRNNAATAQPAGEGANLRRHPRKIVFDQVQVGQWVRPMRIEASGDEHELRPKRLQRREYAVAPCGAELCTS